MTYDKVITALHENNLSWNDVDRILLNEDTYDEFQERASNKAKANYATTDAPAVRPTSGTEKIVYVDQHGYLQEIEL